MDQKRFWLFVLHFLYYYYNYFSSTQGRDRIYLDAEVVTWLDTILLKWKFLFAHPYYFFVTRIYDLTNNHIHFKTFHDVYLHSKPETAGEHRHIQSRSQRKECTRFTDDV